MSLDKFREKVSCQEVYNLYPKVQNIGGMEIEEGWDLGVKGGE